MTKARKVWIVFILGTLSAFGPLSLDMYASALPDMQRSLHTSTSITQLTITTCLIGLAVGQICVGPISDRIGRKIPTLISLVVFALSSFLMAFTNTIEFFIFLRFIQGLGGAVGIVTSKAMCSDIFHGKEFNRYYYALMAVNSAFPVFAPSIGGIFLFFGDWRLIFVALGVIGVLLFIAVFFFKETLSSENAKKAKSHPAIGSMLTNRIFMSFTLVSGFMTGALYAYIAGASFMLENIFGMSAFEFSILYAVNGLGQVLFTWLGARASDKYSDKKTLLVGIIIAIFAGVALLVTNFLPHKLGFVLLPLFLIVALVGIGNPLGSALAIEQERDHAATASAIIGLIQNLLGGLISPLVGLGSKSNYLSMALIIVICEILALFFWLLSQQKNYN